MGVHFEVALRRLVGPDRSGMNDCVVGSRFATDDIWWCCLGLFGVVGLKGLAWPRCVRTSPYLWLLWQVWTFKSNDNLAGATVECFRYSTVSFTLPCRVIAHYQTSDLSSNQRRRSRQQQQQQQQQNATTQQQDDQPQWSVTIWGITIASAQGRHAASTSMVTMWFNLS